MATATAKKIILDERSPEERADGWRNFLTGIGDIGRDKRMSSHVHREDLTPKEIEDLVEADDMADRIVTTLPGEMMREGWEVKIEGDQEAEEATMAMVDELEFNAHMQDALEDARAQGGAGLLLGVEDGTKRLTDPINEARIERIGWLTALPANELWPTDWYRSATEAHYGKPKIYEIKEETFGSQSILTSVGSKFSADLPLVHESRLLKFRGRRLSRSRTKEKKGWGGSVLVPCVGVIRDFNTSWSGAAHLLQDFSQAVMRLKGLTDAMESGNEAAIIKRAQLIDLSRSLARAVILDAEDEQFERVVTPILGLPEMLQQFALRLSAAARMPVSLLLGQAPAGLNATGASDIRFYYDQVKASQRRIARPLINQFLRLLFLSKTGPTKGKEPANWSIKFNPLWQPTEQETADTRLKVAQADALWIANQVVQPYEVAVSHFSGDKFNMDISIDTEAREKLLASSDLPVPGAPDPEGGGSTPPKGGGKGGGGGGGTPAPIGTKVTTVTEPYGASEQVAE